MQMYGKVFIFKSYPNPKILFIFVPVILKISNYGIC